MTAVYVDSSVLLRVVLGEPDRLRSWAGIDRPISSQLIRVDCLRTIDRARIVLGLGDAVVAERRAALHDVLQAFSLIAVNRAVLQRAAEPFPTTLGSLDAIHLASALLLREDIEDLTIATHDLELGLAASAVGFDVDGLPAW
jgi:predicted nucleic acid-binding protein